VECVFWISAAVPLAFWTAAAIVLAWASRRTARLSGQEAPPAALPVLSVVVPARDEECTIEPAMRSLLAQDYPGLEVIAVDDRSSDRTGDVLESLAREDPRLRVMHVRELPSGWLGKNHALHAGAAEARGEWILFTDADVRFAPDTLRRAVAHACRGGIDHLVAVPRVETRGFWEGLWVSFFGVMFSLWARPWAASNPRSRAHIGIGAFNLVRAEAYRRMGGHASLPLEVADDMELGRRMKEAGARQECADGRGLISVRWVVGLRGAMQGSTKNAFAGLGYRPLSVLASAAAVLLTAAWPAAGLLVGPPGARAVSAASLAAMCAAAGGSGLGGSASWLYGLAFPVGGLLFACVLIRSMAAAYLQGGVVWRGTLYPLEELRRAHVRGRAGRRIIEPDGGIDRLSSKGQRRAGLRRPGV